jgi:hypothetical protein
VLLLQVWLGVYDECKVLLPEVERLRRDADAALNRLQEAKDKVRRGLLARQRLRLPAVGFAWLNCM